MKKSIVAITLALVLLLFGGCSCNQKTILSFNKGWDANESSSVSNRTTETAVYKVSYTEDFESGDKYTYKKSDTLKEVLSMAVDGTYSYEIKVIDQSDLTEKAKQSELITSSTATEKPAVIHLTTEFNVNSTYTPKNGTPQTENDIIKTDSFFFRTDLSLAPIYSITEYMSSAVALKTENETTVPEITVYKFVKSIIYNNASYTIKTFDYDAYQANNQVEPIETADYEYTYRTVIDNSALLFATRNVEIADEGYKSLPVVSYTYGEALNLKFTNYLDGSENITVKINQAQEKALSVAVDRIAFGIDATNTGREQLVFIQKEAVKEEQTEILKDKALMIKYVEPLTDYSSYNCLGALVYTLSEIQYS